MSALIPFSTAAESIRSQLPSSLHYPSIAIVCGSGLSGISACLTGEVIIPYSTIPGFPLSSTEGHKSAVSFGKIGEKVVAVMLGRLHVHEGHSVIDTVFPIRVLAVMGIADIILTCSSGSLNPAIGSGQIVVVHDHISLPVLSGVNPLLGPVLPIKTPANRTMSEPPRFLPLSAAYSYDLRVKAFEAGQALGWHDDDIAEGIFAMITGPTYETSAESRMIRAAGADIIAMSSVPETIAAFHAGVNVLMISLVSNSVVTDEPKSAKAAVSNAKLGISTKTEIPYQANHEEVLETAALKASKLTALIKQIITSL